MELNICHVVGTTLLYMDKLSFEDLEKICNQLTTKGYIVNASKENVFSMFREWRDFFMLDLDNNILLTDSAKENKRTVQILFHFSLDINIRNDIINSILYRNKNKSKIIKFQQII